MRIEDFVAKSRAFIEEERRVEQEEYCFMYRKFETEELEGLGLAIRDVQIAKIKSAFFKKAILVLKKKDGLPLPRDLKIKVNDNVIVAERRGKEQGDLRVLFQGVVYRMRADSLQLLVEEKAADIKSPVLGPGTCILKSGDNITFDRRANQHDPVS